MAEGGFLVKFNGKKAVMQSLLIMMKGGIRSIMTSQRNCRMSKRLVLKSNRIEKIIHT